MSNADIFKQPGDVIAGFIVSLFETTPEQIDPVFYNVFVIIMALFFWVQVAKVLVSLIRRLTGFERRR